MAVLTNNNYTPIGDGIAGAINGIDAALGLSSLSLPQSVQANLRSAVHAVNSAANKQAGKRVFVVDRGIVVTALGDDATSIWQTDDGIYQIQPI